MPKARGRTRVFQAKKTVQGAIAGGSGGGWWETRLEKPTGHAGPPRPRGGLSSLIQEQVEARVEHGVEGGRSGEPYPWC